MKKNYILFVLMLIIVIAGCSGGGSDPIPAPSSSLKAITAFSLGGVAGTINETGKTIAVNMPFGTDVTSLAATFTTTGASVKVGSTVQISGTTTNNFTNQVTYTVTAADSTTQNYTVVVTVAESSAKAIMTFSLNGVVGIINETAKTIAITMPFGTSVTNLVATFTKTGSSVKVGSIVQISGTTSNDFTNHVIYTVTAADGSSQNYTVVVTVALSSAKAITAFSLNGSVGTINETGKTIAVSMPYGTYVMNLVATFTTTGASVKVGSTVQVSGTTAHNFTSPVKYTVTAADGSTQDYTVTVTVALSPAKAITAFSLNGSVGTINETGKTITVSMPYGTYVVNLVATFITTGASVKVGSTVQISGSTANNFTSSVTYTVTAADGTTQDYTVTVVLSGSLDSPFGMTPVDYVNNYAYAQDLGLKWDRDGLYFVWEWIDSGRNGKYSFTHATIPPLEGTSGTGGPYNYDLERIALYSADIKMIINICPYLRSGEFQSDAEKAIYQDFVTKTVERYDGDEDLGCTLASPDCYTAGDGQYPSNDLISKLKAQPIKYWQVCNHVYDTCSTDCRNTYATKYAEVLELTYNAVKQADSSANVLIAGDSVRDSYPAVYAALGGKYIDIIDFHRFGQYDWYNPKDDINFLKASLQASGFDTSTLRFWITATGTYSGIPTKDVGNGYQSEKQQAQGLFKAYISALANGIEKVLWAWGLVEGFNYDCSIFDFTGLVYDGCDCINGTYTCGTNIGYDKGSGVKKLSYYTYKKMVETIDGSDLTNIATIQESSGVYIYKFIKNGNPIWVAWNDNTNSQIISLDVGTINTVKTVEAIPKYASGSEVTDYNSAFNTVSKTAQSGKVTVTLNDVPVFVGETL